MPRFRALQWFIDEYKCSCSKTWLSDVLASGNTETQNNCVIDTTMDEQPRVSSLCVTEMTRHWEGSLSGHWKHQSVQTALKATFAVACFARYWSDNTNQPKQQRLNYRSMRSKAYQHRMRRPVINAKRWASCTITLGSCQGDNVYPRPQQQQADCDLQHFRPGMCACVNLCIWLANLLSLPCVQQQMSSVSWKTSLTEIIEGKECCRYYWVWTWVIHVHWRALHPLH